MLRSLHLLVVLTSLLVGLVAGQISTIDQWNRYKSDYGLVFTPQEDDYRLGIFTRNLARFDHHNRQGSGSRMGINQYAYLTNAEFKAKIKAQNVRSFLAGATHLTKADPVFTPPLSDQASWDWNRQGVIGPVEDQGDCGACWAFVTTEVVRACHLIKGRRMPVLSNGQLNHCSHLEGNLGCDGGLPSWAMEYVQKNGLVAANTYPYTPRDGTCTGTTSPAVARISGFVKLPPNDPNAQMRALAISPIAVVIQGSSEMFQHYSGGIISGNGCTTDWDHAVVIVGYGTSNGTPYWIAKNSWGTDWGERGFLRIARSTTYGPGACGISSLSTYATC